MVPGLVRSSDTLTHRALNPEWYWNDPLFNVVAGLAGLEPPKNREVVSTDVDEVKRLLSLPRKPLSEGGKK